ncbi:MAG TPA: ion channel, partial [Polyangiaceae bacterium]
MALGVLVFAFLAVNAVFAAIYVNVGGVAGVRPGSFFDAFAFSVETMATIGYGAMHPESPLAHVLVIVQAIVGLLSTALVTGLVFTKFSQSTARIVFSERLALAPMNGVPTLTSPWTKRGGSSWIQMGHLVRCRCRIAGHKGRLCGLASPLLYGLGMSLRKLVPLAALALLATAAGCAADVGDVDSDEAELQSLSARSRTLQFDGYVYVDANASDSSILQAVRSQTQTAFGALRTSQIGVNSRELKDVNPKTFVKTKVTVIDTSKTGDPGTPMLKVTYRYTDNAVVPTSMSRRTSLSSAVMSGHYGYQTQRILKECTANDSEAQEFSSSIWYVFEPSLSTCKTA